MQTATEQTEVEVMPSSYAEPAIASDIPAHKVDGPLSAVLLAAGIGAFILGLLTTWAEASASFKTDLQLDDEVGPLSGKTVYSTIAFFVSWGVLAYMMRRRDGTLRTATIVFAVLTALGFLMTFPIFFQAFAPE